MKVRLPMYTSIRSGNVTSAHLEHLYKIDSAILYANSAQDNANNSMDAATYNPATPTYHSKNMQGQKEHAKPK